MPIWDVASAPPQEQFDYWREVICRAFVPLTPTRAAPGHGFPSRVEVRPLGTMNRTVLSSRPQRTAHSPADVKRTAGAFYFVNLQLAGVCRVRHLGHDDMVRPGHFTVVDTTEPYYFDLPHDWQMASFRISHAQLPSTVPNRLRGVGVAVDTHSGPGQVVATLMRALWGLDGGACAGPAADLWEKSFVAAIAAALSGGPDRDRAPEPDLRRAIECYVRQNLQSSVLSAHAVCSHFAISPRYLHKLFSMTGGPSFGALVRGERLRRCAELLASSDNHGSVAEVAARYGFSHPTSFARAFRREFGVTPSDVRRSGVIPEQP